MRTGAMAGRCRLTLMCGLTLVLLGTAATAQEPEYRLVPCPTDENLSVQAVRIARWDPSMGHASKNPVPIDTIVFPTDSAFLYVQGLVSVGSAKPGDSIYAETSFDLLLHSAPTVTDTAGATVLFPSRIVVDTLAPLGRQTKVVLGPIPADSLIPWPDRTVRATANANPWGAKARAAVMRVRRGSGNGWLASVKQAGSANNIARMVHSPPTVFPPPVRDQE